jgi:hypothetical protein
MSKVRVSAFYCEDFRVEDTQQPMFLGVMSPSLWVENLPVEVPSLIFVTMFHIDNSLDSVTAKLRIEVEGESDVDSDRFPINLEKTFEKNTDHIDGDWMIISHLDLSGMMLKRNMTIKSILKCSDYSETIFLNIRGV